MRQDTRLAYQCQNNIVYIHIFLNCNNHKIQCAHSFSFQKFINKDFNALGLFAQVNEQHEEQVVFAGRQHDKSAKNNNYNIFLFLIL